MKQSELFTHTRKQPPRDETSVNARLLEQAGFIAKLMSGVYSYLPLGLRVLRKIESIVRDELEAIGALEGFFPALQPKELWERTGRWKSLAGTMYQFLDPGERPVGLAITHEEVVADIARRFVHSYKDLPFAVFQMQTKFRHELRAKSGLLRGREFAMKDLYSCHRDQDDCDGYYEKVAESYLRIFRRLGLSVRRVEASGGTFSRAFSHEFQVVTDAGEDHLFLCPTCDFAQNKEVSKTSAGERCPKCKDGRIEERRGIEVANIFKLGTAYTAALGASYADESGKQQPIVMASYGIGLSRVLATHVEVFHDEHGIIWPDAVAPFALHLLHIGADAATKRRADAVYRSLTKKGIETLYDDRAVAAGEKFNDADLLGIPNRVVISKRTGSQCEFRRRNEPNSTLLALPELQRRFKPE